MKNGLDGLEFERAEEIGDAGFERPYEGDEVDLWVC